MKKIILSIVALMSMTIGMRAQNIHLSDLTADNVYLEGNLTGDSFQRIHVSFHNSSDSVCSVEKLCVASKCDGESSYHLPYTEPQGITLAPGESQKVVLLTMPSRISKQHLVVCDGLDDAGVPHDVFCSITARILDPHEFDLTATVSIDNGISTDDGIVVNDTRAIISASLTNNESVFFGAPVYLKSYKLRQSFGDIIEAGETKEMTVQMEDLEPGKKYSVRVEYFDLLNCDPFRNWCCDPVYFTVADNTNGIESVNATDTTSEILDLQGKRRAGSIDALPAGIYLANGKKVVKQ